ncbi:30S ribosomal protein S20 [Candidatus Peregrinibacteria bacterium]|nr:30S ribosomal protein S20 [Candidatus Peregrinibacteria bacterium]
MANKKSALKELRKTQKRTTHNNRMKTHFKHLYRQCVDLIEANEMDKAKEKAVEFQQTADKAAKRHIISRNRANRKKSALWDMIHGKRQTPPIKGKGKGKVKTLKTEPAPEPETQKTEEPAPETQPQESTEKTA